MHRFIPLAFAVATFTAAPYAGAKDAQTVPFHATLSITEQIQFNFVPPCFATGEIYGTGTATHLGRVTFQTTDCINPTLDGGFTFASPVVVLRAANGDALYLTYSGSFALSPQGVGTFSGPFTVVCGTGRFARTTGGGVVQGSEQVTGAPPVQVGQGEATLSGQLNLHSDYVNACPAL